MKDLYYCQSEGRPLSKIVSAKSDNEGARAASLAMKTMCRKAIAMILTWMEDEKFQKTILERGQLTAPSSQSRTGERDFCLICDTGKQLAFDYV